MTPFDRLLESLVGLDLSPWFFLKILVLIGLGIYIAFAIVIVRQVSLMTKALNVELEGLIRVVAWAHLMAALGLFFLALIIL